MNNKEIGDFVGHKWPSIIDQKNLKRSPNFKGSELTLVSNEIKDVIKVIRSLENKGILLKVTTREISSQKVGFLNCLRPIVSGRLPLMKNVHATLVESIFILLGLTIAASVTDSAIQKKKFWSDMTALITLKEPCMVSQNS